MSRLDELKKQYPELNVTIMDILYKFDNTKSYKYLPLLCKIFGKRFTPQMYVLPKDAELEIQSSLMQWGISTDNLTINQMCAINLMLDFLSRNDIQFFQSFKDYMERGLIENKDVTSYKSIEEITGVVSLAAIKEFEKSLEAQVIKVYEDDTWLVIKPLTFSASSKYGAGTRWCTTYQREKQYFEKYWRNGILAYFLNKKTGYKFAGYKEIHNGSEMSFWNSADSRIDYLEIEIDDYMFPIVKSTFKSKESNKELSSNEIQEQVHTECLYLYDKISPVSVSEIEITFNTEPQTPEIPPDTEYDAPIIRGARFFEGQEPNQDLDGTLESA